MNGSEKLCSADVLQQFESGAEVTRRSLNGQGAVLPADIIAALDMRPARNPAVPPADPHPECLATLVRHHGGIELLRWLRDTVYHEDNSTARTRSGPRVMASLPVD